MYVSDLIDKKFIFIVFEDLKEYDDPHPSIIDPSGA